MDTIAVRHATSTIDSKVIATYAGQLFNGLPATLCGYATTVIHQHSVNPPQAPRNPAANTIFCTVVLRNPTASANPSTGIGEYASILSNPASRADSAAASSASGVSNSAISPYRFSSR